MKKIIFTLLTVALVASCSKAEQGDKTLDGGPQPITFGSTIDLETKVGETSVQFTNGETIKVLGYRNTTAGAPASFAAPFLNSIFTYTSPNFASTPATYWQLGQAHNFYAYYPSTLVLNTLTAAAPTAVLNVTATGVTQGDIMTATKVEKGIYAGGAAARTAVLAFSHRLSMVKFKVVRQANVPTLATLSKIEFSMAKNAGSLNIVTGAVTNSGSSVALSKNVSYAIPVTTTTPPYVTDASWFVLPGDQISGVVLTIGDVRMTATGISTLTTEPGKITTITATVKANGITLTSTIKKWGANGAATDELKPIIPPPANSIIYATANNNGAILSSTKDSYNTWKGEAATPGVNGGNGQYRPSTLGVFNQELPYYQFEVAKADEMGSNAVNWADARTACWNKTTDGGVWRLPRASELCMVSYNLTALEAAGVETFGGATYWTSTEYNVSYCWFLPFGGSLTGNGSKINSAHRVRCIREF